MDKNDFLQKAETIFWRLLGVQLTSIEYVERFKNSPKGVKLSHPFLSQIKNIKARSQNGGNFFHDYHKIFGSTEWMDIPLEHTTIFSSHDSTTIVLPPSIFGTLYDEVEIIYEAGLLDMPDDIRECIKEMSFMLESGELNEWNLFLPTKILDVIEKYRKEVGVK